jgi:hypothetical protein
MRDPRNRDDDGNKILIKVYDEDENVTNDK